MRVLVDNCVPLGITKFLTGHTVTDSVSVGLQNIVNGKLLQAAEGVYDILLTSDQNIVYQQNLTNRQLAIVAVNTNHWPTIRRDPHKIVHAVNAATSGSYQLVTYPSPPLRRRPFQPGLC
jgi:hypothetical protein